MSGSIETLRQNLAALNVTSPQGAEIAREVRGSYRGEEVATSSEASKLQDASEELGMSVAHRADKKSLDRREVRQGAAATLEALARIADYYDKLPNMPREEQLRGLVEQLQNFERLLNEGGSGSGVTTDDIMKALQELDGDVTHQFAALDIAREFFTAAGASEDFMMLLDQAHAEFSKGDLGREVRAGLASAKEAAQAPATLETDPAAVREAYRSLLRETRNMGQLFQAFQRFDMMKKFDEVVSLFMSVAGQDLASTGPSTDPTHLHNLLTELSKLKLMQSAVSMAFDLVTMTDRQLQPGESPQGTPADVAERMLLFASNAAAGPMEARALLQRYMMCSVARRLAFANGLRDMHGELPDQVMPNGQARLQQRAALLALLDELVEEEEAEYEGQAGN